MANTEQHLALGDVAARQLANAQKTAPTMQSITPRWLVALLPWVGVEAGIRGARPTTSLAKALEPNLRLAPNDR
ncbi:MAG: hypothetical protein ACLP0J_16745 [Solirubrobacteraceae bacterium]